MAPMDHPLDQSPLRKATPEHPMSGESLTRKPPATSAGKGASLTELLDRLGSALRCSHPEAQSASLVVNVGDDRSRMILPVRLVLVGEAMITCAACLVSAC